MTRIFSRLIRAAHARPFHPLLPLWTAVWVAGIRFLAEKALVYDANPAPMNVLGALLSWVAYYFALAMSMAALVRIATASEWKRSLQAVSFGLVVAILPPFLDVILYGRGHFSYRYQVDFAPEAWLFFAPSRGLPLGETAVVWGGIALVAAYVYFETRSWWRAALAACAQYALGIVFGVALPVAEQWLARQPGMAAVGDNWLVAWMCLGLALVSYLVLRPQLFRATFLRLPQIALAPAIAFLGAAYVHQKDALAAVAATAFAGVAAAFALTNLYYDRQEDEAQGRALRVDHDDVVWLYAWAALLCLTLMRYETELCLCLVLFLLTAHAYHADPLRLKCLFPAAYKAEGFFAATAFLGGIVAHTSYRLASRDIWATALIFGGFSLSAPFKDAKDIAGDKAAGVRTLYVVLERWPVARVQLLTSAVLGACLLAPVAILAGEGRSAFDLALPLLFAFAAPAATWSKNRALGVAIAVTLVAVDVAVLAMIY